MSLDGFFLSVRVEHFGVSCLHLSSKLESIIPLGIVFHQNLVTTILSHPNFNNRKKCLHDHLPPTKQRVADELARPQGNRSVGHGVDCKLTARETVFDKKNRGRLGKVGGRGGRVVEVRCCRIIAGSATE